MDTSLKGHLRSRQHFFMRQVFSETINIFRINKLEKFSHFYKARWFHFFFPLVWLIISIESLDDSSMSHQWVIGWEERVSHSFTHRIMSHPNSNIFKYYDIWFIYLSEKWFQVQEFFIFQEFWKTINIITTEAYLFSRKLVNKMHGSTDQRLARHFQN